MTAPALANTAPTLSGFSPSLTITNASVPQVLDEDVQFADAEGNFAGGRLTMTGLLAEDRIGVRNEGTGAGQIGVSGSNVTYGGVVIGTLSGGAGTTFQVSLNANSSAAAVDALIENLTYANVSEEPTDSRKLILNVTDADGASLTPDTIIFTERTGAANPFGGVYVGGYTAPALGDLDGDGDLDVLVGDYDGKFRAFRNNGDGSFSLAAGSANPLAGVDVGFYAIPTFGDLDGDGDVDLVVGNNDGTLITFLNADGTFTKAVGAADPFAGLDVGFVSSPRLADIDGDGDADMVVGEVGGVFRTFRNDGGTFTELTGAANPLNGIDVGQRSTPAFMDIDADGDLDLLSGSDGPWRAFRNDGGVFTEVTGQANPMSRLSTPGRAVLDFADVDGDGDIDAIAGEIYGGVHYYENVTQPGNSIVIDIPFQDRLGVAHDDTATVHETGAVSIDVVANDVDPDGPAVATVNGVPIAAGGAVTLASGAIIRMGSDGRLVYDPNPKFDWLVAHGSGAVNTSAQDSFTYTIVGGSSATVTVTINGIISEGDILAGDATDNVITGTYIADTIDLTAGGQDAATGGNGDDLFLLGASFTSADTIFGGNGNDTLRLQGDYSLGLSLGADSLAEVETLQLVAGFDYALALHDGNVAAGKVLVVEGRALGANDSLAFDGRAETNGAFDLRGGRADDVLRGGAMNDVLDGGRGDDMMAGGKGNDLYEVDDTADKVIELAGEGTDRVLVSLSSYTLGANVENLRGMSNAGQSLTGNGLANDIRGGSGADTIDGGGGADVMHGNGGDDVYRVDNVADRVIEQAGEGTDTVLASASWSMVGSFVETLTLTGTAAIDGKGNGQANRINGNAAANRIDGGGGDDVLAGGGGRDVLSGGAGADGFLFDSVLDGSGNVDRITDFSAADDRFLLDSGIFSGIGSGVLDAGAFQLGGTAKDADERILYDQASGHIFYDADGSGVGGAILFATVEAGTILSAGDFFGV